MPDEAEYWRNKALELSHRAMAFSIAGGVLAVIAIVLVALS